MGWINRLVKHNNTCKSGDTNWFQNNPKKTLFFVILAAFLLIVFIAEEILQIKNEKQMSKGIQRHIRLREKPPFFFWHKLPTDQYMLGADSLVKKYYRMRVDENGFIIPSKKYEKPDKVIVFLGGSTTESFLVDEENRFPYLAGILLEQKTGFKINSYNSGVSGNNSLHSLNILLNKIIPLKPDVVVMMHNINDLTILLRENSYWNNHPTRSVILVQQTLTIYSILRDLKNIIIPNFYDEVWKLYKYIFGGSITDLNEDAFRPVSNKRLSIDKNRLIKEFEMNLQTFISICRARGIIPILMTQENRLTNNPDKLTSDIMAGIERDIGISYKEYKEIYDLFNQIIRDIGKKNNVKVIDLAVEIPQSKEYMYDIFHFNDKGSRLAAHVISREIYNIIAQ